VAVTALARYKSGGSAVIVRGLDRSAFRVYSENVGYVVVALSYTGFGRAQYAKGASPEHILRLVELYRSCSETLKAQARSDQTGWHVKRCRPLADAIRAALPEGSTGAPSAEGLSRQIAGGIVRDPRECLSKISSDPASKMIEEFEQYAECRRNEQRVNGQRTPVGPSGVMTGGSADYAPHRDGPQHIQDLLQGAQFVSQSLDEVITPSGIGAQITSEYTKPDGAGGTQRITVAEYSMATVGPNGNLVEETGYTVTIRDSEGTTINQYVNTDSGTVQVSTHWEGVDPGGASTQAPSYSASFNENGTLQQEVIVDQDGTVTVNEYDEKGNLKSTNTGNVQTADLQAATQPIDETIQSSCSAPGAGRLDTRVSRGASRLGPWIIPNPETAPESVTDLCVSAFFRNPPRKCGPSVAMCIDSVASTDRCQCVTRPTETGGWARGAAICQQINCGPGGTCDAATGTCRTSGASGGRPFPGSYLGRSGPGVKTPILHGPPSVLRGKFSGQNNLWYPDDTKPNLQKLFGRP
jgi:hypothetical protein